MTARSPLAAQRLSLVVPVYNESEGVAEFHRRASKALSELSPLDHEIVYVDDGSTDDSYPRLRAFADTDPRISVVKLSRNFGHQNAITAGLDHARGDCVVVIDADLQDPPEVIAAMVAKWRQGYDVVYGQRTAREGETAVKRLTAALFYRLFRAVARVDIPSDVGEFRLLSRRAVDELRRMRETDRFVRGMVSWIGFPQARVLYRRDARHKGASKYPMARMLRFATDGFTAFSMAPLRVATWLGCVAAGLALLALLSAPLRWIFGPAVPELSAPLAVLVFLGGAQLVCLGILGEYVGRIFREVKRRPLYVVEDVVGADPGTPTGPSTGR